VLWLVPLALFAVLGQLCMTRAYNRGATLVVATLQYFGLAFGVFYGMTLFGDRLTPLGWVGMGLVVASGIAATILRASKAPDAPGEAH
jgi:drug/metabolite transporter (DMT)-like permease